MSRVANYGLRGLLWICSVGTVLVHEPAQAATSGDKEIIDIQLVNGGAVALIRFGSGGFEVPDACHTQAAQHFAISTITNEGKALLSMATAAFLAGKVVLAIGSNGNNCIGYTQLSVNSAGVTTATNRAAETLGQLLVR